MLQLFYSYGVSYYINKKILEAFNSFICRMKKTILYIIDSLAGIGGAEIIMVAPLKEIHEHYNVIVVTLHPVTINVFEENYFLGDRQLCLQMRSRKDILTVASK